MPYVRKTCEDVFCMKLCFSVIVSVMTMHVCACTIELVHSSSAFEALSNSKRPLCGLGELTGTTSVRVLQSSTIALQFDVIQTVLYFYKIIAHLGCAAT